MILIEAIPLLNLAEQNEWFDLGEYPSEKQQDNLLNISRTDNKPEDSVRLIPAPFEQKDLWLFFLKYLLSKYFHFVWFEN